MLTYALPTGKLSADFSFEKRTVLEGLLARQDREYRKLDEVKPVASRQAASPHALKEGDPRKDGIDISMSAAEAASDWARRAAQVGATRLLRFLVL